MMLALLDPRVWLVFLILAASSYAGGRFQQWKADEQRYQALRLEATEASRKQEQEWNQKIQEARDAEAAEKTRIAGVFSDALIRLRNRPQRLPEAARPACQGATGAELSDIDGTFLVRESARADGLRASLKTCQDWIDAVTSGSERSESGLYRGPRAEGESK